MEENENLLFQQATASSIYSGSEKIVNCSFATGKVLYYLRVSFWRRKRLKNVGSMDKNVWNKYSQVFQPTFKNASFMIQCCIGPNGVGRLVQCDRRMNTTCNASFLQENLSESINDFYGNQAKHLIFEHHNAATGRAELTQNFFRQQYITSQVSCSKLWSEQTWKCLAIH